MTTKKLVPRASGEGAMGVTDNAWGEAYYDTGNFNKGLFVSGHNITQVIAETVTQGGLGGEWTRNGLDIYYNGGNVGIGTTNPIGVLHVSSENANTIRLTRELDIRNSANGGASKIEGGALVDASPSMGGAIGFVLIDSNGVDPGTDIEGYLYLETKDSGASLTEKMRITSAGNVGIGTTNPIGVLHVSSENANTIRLTRELDIRNSANGAASKIEGGALVDASPSMGGAIGFALIDSNGVDPGTDTEGYLCLETKDSGASLTEKMRITSAGNVGIGTTNPGARLDILGSFKLNNPGGATLYPSSTDVYKNGTTSSLKHSAIFNTGGWRNATVIESVTGTTPSNFSTEGLYLNSTYGSKPFTSASIQVNCSTGNGDISFLTGDGSAAPTSKIKLQNNGDVGIGVTSPGAKLHIQGDDNEIYDANDRLQRNRATFFAYNISNTNGSYSQLVLGNRNSTGSMSRISSVLVQQGTSKLSFSTTKNSTQSESVVISSDGIDIKSRSSQRFCQANWSSGALLSGYNGYITVDSGPNGNKTIQKFVIGATDTWIADGFEGVSIRCASSVQDSFIFKPNGNLYGLNWAIGGTISINANGEIVTSSDKRLKNDLGDCEYGLNEVLQLKPKKYTWKDGPKDQKPTIGFFAQDLYGVMEEAGPRTAKLDDKGNSVTDEDGKPDYDWGMNSNAIIAALVNAAKEQQQLIEDLKSRIETLENK